MELGGASGLGGGPSSPWEAVVSSRKLCEPLGTQALEASFLPVYSTALLLKHLKPAFTLVGTVGTVLPPLLGAEAVCCIEGLAAV